MAEGVTIDGVSLSVPGFCRVTNLRELWQGPLVRGSDRMLPGVAGVKSYRRRATVTRRILNLIVDGLNDHAGTPHANPFVGLEVNVNFLRANVADPTGIGDGTRTLILTLPSGATKQAAVHVESFELAEFSPVSVKAALDLSIPGGALA